jgi:hypothetical protein
LTPVDIFSLVCIIIKNIKEMKMGKRKRGNYNNDFKLRAVKLCLETDKPDAEIARDLGVQHDFVSTKSKKNQNTFLNIMKI